MRRIAPAGVLVAGLCGLPLASADSIALHMGSVHPGEQVPCSRNPGIEYSTGTYAFGVARNSYCRSSAYAFRRLHVTRRVVLGAGLITGYEDTEWGATVSPLASASVKLDRAVVTYLPGPSGGALLLSLHIPLDGPGR